MRCRACDGSDLATVFVMEPMPLAGAFTRTKKEAKAAETYPLEWRRCQTCGLVNVWPDIPDETIYRHYSYHASDVPALVEHHAEFADWLRRFEPRLHVEIGGNDGVLTNRCPWPTLNVDPSDAWVGPGFNEPFTSALARTIGKADLVTSSNAFAHFTDIGDALDGVREMLTPTGHFVIEVHDLEATLREETWDTVYHEHKVEWSFASLWNAGRRHGLHLLMLDRLPLHGGLLRAVFRRGDIRHDLDVSEDFSWLQRAYDKARAPHLPKGSTAYGASARATVYLNRTRPHVKCVYDASPRRHGWWVPGLGIPILPPKDFDEHAPACLITAWNHAEDIMASHPDYRGRWEATWQT